MWLAGTKKEGKAMSLILKQDINADLWTKYIHGHRLATIFHDLDWLDILEKSYNVKIVRLGFFKGGCLVGVMPLSLQKLGFFKILGSPLSRMSTQYQGFLIDDGISLLDIFAALDKYQKENKIDYLQLYFNEKLPENLFENYGYATETCKTYVIDLNKNKETLWQDLEKSCRYKIRKAENLGLEILEANSLDNWLEDYWFILNQLYGLQNMLPPDPKQFYINIWNKLNHKNKIKVLLVRSNNKIIAGSISLLYKNKVYGLDGVSLREQKTQGPNNALEWYLIKWAQKNGFGEYDMLGANIPRIAKFKKSFGGNLREYTYAYRSNNAISKIARSAYQKSCPYIRSFQKSLLKARKK